MKGKPKAHQTVWVYSQEGGRQVALSSLFPEGKVPLKKKIIAIGWLVLGFLILFFMLWFSKKYGK